MNKLALLLHQVGKRQDVMLAVMLMATVFMMILPLPTVLIDVFLAFNLTFSVVLLMMAVYIDNPLEFSVFPSVLLLTTLFRLALTVSTSRLILLQHDAGHIVYTFGNFVVGGNLIVGLIVFLIITVVQFIVITKGAERVAEVSARFSLDGMPGKQMSIDGDMRAGVIDSQEAKEQRALVQKESQLYGAMDGAMKFVKGDAIASLVVILINLVGGLCVGIFVHGMAASDALNTYAILSIGDGLVDQIPGLLISITAGIVVTRVPDRDNENLAKTLIRQITGKPMALVVAAILVLVFAAIPGFPFIDFLLLAGVIAGMVLFSKQGKSWLKKIRSKDNESLPEETEEATFTGVPPLSMEAYINIASAKELKENIKKWVNKKSDIIGFPLPEVRLTVRKPENEQNKVVISLYGTPVIEELFAQNECLTKYSPGFLKEQGIAFREKKTLAENLSLFWVDKQSTSPDKLNDTSRVFQDEQGIITFLLESVIDRYAKEFIGIQETRYIIDNIEPKFTELLKEVQRQLSVSQIAEIFQRLVAESVSIKNLRTIFESLVDWAQKEKDILLLTEYVRISLQRYLSYTYSQGSNEINVFMVGDETEKTIREGIRQTDSGAYLALSPDQTSRIIEQIKGKIENISIDNTHPVFITSMDVRRYLRKLLESQYYEVPVVSYQEITKNLQVNVLATV